MSLLQKTITIEIAQVTSLGYGLKKTLSGENKRPCLLARQLYLLTEVFLEKTKNVCRKEIKAN